MEMKLKKLFLTAFICYIFKLSLFLQTIKYIFMTHGSTKEIKKDKNT